MFSESFHILGSQALGYHPIIPKDIPPVPNSEPLTPDPSPKGGRLQAKALTLSDKVYRRSGVVFGMHSNEPVGWAQPRLNFDVLRLVCNDLTEVSDVLSFALTCSALRKSALQRRLRMSPVSLSRTDSVERFHRFIFADPASRAPHLYGLWVSPELYYAANDDPSCANHLIAILEATTHLEYLSFSTAMGLPVCATVEKITTLRELTVHSDWGYYTDQQPEAVTNLLTVLRSPLQYLSIADYESGQISVSFIHDHLFRFAATLESLRVQEFPFNISPSSVTTQFTALRSLRIDAMPYLSHFYRLDVLLRLFPNLDDTLFLKGFMPPVDQYSVLREQSKEAQKDYTWPRLDHVIYSAELAFMMALRCPIHRMDIDVLVTREASYLAEALRDNCPQRLLMPIMFSGRDSLQSLDGLFAPGAVDKLTHLVMFAEINIIQRRRPTGELDNFSWEQFMDHLVDSLKHLCRLTHLCLIFDQDIDSVGRPVLESVQPQAPFEEDFVQYIAHETDLHPAAIQIIDAMQSLKYVSLTTCGQRRYSGAWKYWHSSKAWRVVEMDKGPNQLDMKGPGGSGSCVEITGDEAEAVIDEEELYLRYREANMVWHCIENTSK